MLQLVNFKWTTTLPTNTVINETAYLAESKNALLMKSRDRDLSGEGYDKSTSLIDFDTVYQLCMNLSVYAPLLLPILVTLLSSQLKDEANT